MAKGLIKGNIAENILLMVSASASKYINKKDRAKRSLFDDAAAASIITPAEKDQILEFEFGTDGNNRNLVIPNGAFRKRFDQDAIEFEYEPGSFGTDNNLQMNGHEIINFTLLRVPSLIRNVLKKNNFTIDTVDYFIFLQANKLIVDHLRKMSKIPPEKFCLNMENTVNTSSCTIPIAMKDALERKSESTKEKDRLGFRRPTEGSIPKPVEPFFRPKSGELLRLAFNGIFAQWVPRMQTLRPFNGSKKVRI